MSKNVVLSSPDETMGTMNKITVAIAAHELRVGDRIHSYRANSNAKCYVWAGELGQYDVSQIMSTDPVSITFMCNGNGKIYEERRLMTSQFLVIRGVMTKNSDFPSRCTRCDRPAYVSAFSVEHEDEVAARNCPARRA